MWRDLFAAEPPPYNRKYLESRLAYRVQELAYGGLKPETLKRLAALPRSSTAQPGGAGQGNCPVAGTRLLREWQGVEHCVTVPADGYRISGPPLPVAVGDRPHHHRHALERLAVLRSRNQQERRPMKDDSSGQDDRPKAALRGLHPQVVRRRARQGVQLPRCPA